MKKLAIATFVVTSCLSLVSTGFAKPNACSGVTAESIKSHLTQGPPITIVDKKPLSTDVCEVSASIKQSFGPANLISFYTIQSPDNDKKISNVIIGVRFKDKKPVSIIHKQKLMTQYILKHFKNVMPLAKKSVITSYTPKKFNGKVAYVFTDPECPFCKKLGEHLKEMADASGYKIALLPFIIHGEKSKQDIANFISNKKGFNDYLKGNFGKKAKISKNVTDIITSVYKIADESGLRGTPAILTSDGKIVLGFDVNSINRVFNVNIGK